MWGLGVCVLGFVVAWQARGDVCSQYGSCADCLNPADPALDCGWCSPDPAVSASGDELTQCMDHTSKGWDCFHLYMHDGCVAGYVCNATTGECALGQPGEGDTMDNCQAACSPAAKTYACNATSFQCYESPDGSSTDADDCASHCADQTPSDIVGLWRGIDVQVGFAVGEWVLNFTSTTAAWGPLSDPRQTTATVATVGSSLLRLATSDDVFYASCSTPGWPTGPETRAIALALGISHAIPPANVADALGSTDFRVFVAHQCNSWGDAGCDFAPAFETSSSSFVDDDDPCTAHSDCTSCIDDPLDVCGWCDGVITFGDGSTCGDDGDGCCGGASGFSQCDVAYRKECPVLCDWTNWTSPTCRAATTNEINAGVQTYADCDDVAAWCASTTQFCNASTSTCYTVADADECRATPGCDPSNAGCDSCTAPSYYYCDDGCQGPVDAATCAAIDKCQNTTSCDPTTCAASTYYVCESYECVEKKSSGGAPPDGAYNTSADCRAACAAPPPNVTGVWRGLRVDQDFVVDEWDFEFFENGTVVFASTATVYAGTYDIGGALTDVDNVDAYVVVVTLTSPTAQTWTGLISDASSSSAGPITKFLYLGLPLADGDTTSDYDDAMRSENQEFVLVACLASISGCDFSNAKP